MNAVCRYCTIDYVLETRLSLFVTLEAAATGQDTANVLGRHFLTDLGLNAERLVCLSRDSCATNNVAIDRLHGFFPDTANVLCVSHILSSAGGKADLPCLDRVRELLPPTHVAYLLLTKRVCVCLSSSLRGSLSSGSPTRHSPSGVD